MQKIISLFQRDREPKHGPSFVRNEVTPGAEWVIAGEGTATRKFDGACCLIRDGKLFKRYDVKNGKPKPENFEPAQEPDPVTGHWPGWVPVGDGPDDRWHREAFSNAVALGAAKDGTYELCGPKIQSNPEKFDNHILVRHGVWMLTANPRTFDTIREYLLAWTIEGIVWHHPDGRMVKIKRKDFAAHPQDQGARP